LGRQLTAHRVCHQPLGQIAGWRVGCANDAAGTQFRQRAARELE
jgi:hypothetical protein